MRYLVIGSEGVIGSKLWKALSIAGNEVIRCDIKKIKAPDYYIADMTHYDTLNRVFGRKPDVVFHLAAEVGRETSEIMPSVTIESNVIGTMNVISHCLAIDARLVYISTSEAYGRLFSEPDGVTEDMTPRGQAGIYGLTKWMGEELIELYSRRYRLDARICRLFMCYGEGEHANPYRSAIIRFIEAALKDEPIYVHRGSLRSWCYIDDIVKGIITTGHYEPTTPGELPIFNIGKDDMRTMEWVAEYIKKLTGSSSEIVFTDAEPDISIVKRANFSKAKQVLGWEAAVPVEEGIRWTVEWVKTNRALRA